MVEPLVKVARYGSIFEIIRFQKPLLVGYRRHVFVRRVRSMETLKTIQNIWRLKRRIKRDIFSCMSVAGIPAFATFTYSKPQLDVERAIQNWRDFTRRVKKFFPDVAFLRVPERHKKGGVHWHAVMFGLLSDLACLCVKRGNRYVHACSKDKLCERRVRVLAKLWGHGFVDLSVVRKPESIGVYLAKYLTKGEPDWSLFGRHLASCNQKFYYWIGEAKRLGLSYELSSYKSPIAVGTILDDMRGVLVPTKVSTFETHWLGSARYELFRVNPFSP